MFASRAAVPAAASAATAAMTRASRTPDPARDGFRGFDVTSFPPSCLLRPRSLPLQRRSFQVAHGRVAADARHAPGAGVRPAAIRARPLDRLSQFRVAMPARALRDLAVVRRDLDRLVK